MLEKHEVVQQMFAETSRLQEDNLAESPDANPLGNAFNYDRFFVPTQKARWK